MPHLMLATSSALDLLQPVPLHLLITLLLLDSHYPFSKLRDQLEKHENQLDMRGPAQIKGQQYIEHVHLTFLKLAPYSQDHNTIY